MEDRFRFRAWNKIKQSYDYDIQECKKIPLSNSNKEKCFACFQSYLDNQDVLKIEQCTGLKDKNGKLIYEGDIVRADSRVYNVEALTLVIRFHNGAFMAGDRFIDNNSIFMNIIGNIHENPELLEEE